MLIIASYSFAQNFIEYESFGFNLIESNVFTGGMYDTAEIYFYRINNPSYSVMRLCNLRISSSSPNDVIAWIFRSEQYELQEEYYQIWDGERRYYLRQWYDSEERGRSFSWNMYNGGYEGPMGVGIRYITDRSGKLTAVELTGAYREGRYMSKNVIYNQDGSISVNFERPIDHIYIRFYNIPEEKLTDIYLSAFTQDIRRNINAIGEDSLRNRTKEELAIIRNCLFAKYNYSFQTPQWRNFMLKYYDPNYRGTYSNQEAMDRFSESDRLLLELVLKYENN
jgi:hypothetical protein